ncbi:hypothetical protein [Mycobacterium sp. E787]|uniref:hypothetical protein n=1 Tax=Mycobacterium sp. E787 TaxID=1834150 RepID=UPI000B15ADEE|nr:hypothetical protein [Mycobacterium sp. E787]
MPVPMLSRPELEPLTVPMGNMPSGCVTPVLKKPDEKPSLAVLKKPELPPLIRPPVARL